MKGIMFKEDLFRKVVSGQKTQIRRVVKSEKPRYKEGEIVYLKEPYCEVDGKIYYKFDWLEHGKSIHSHCPINPIRQWKNKMFMPYDKARYFIRITDVKMEKLQDMSEEDYLAEGVEYPHESRWPGLLRICWITLWNSISKKEPYRWKDNPNVWVYTFEMWKLGEYDES